MSIISERDEQINNLIDDNKALGLRVREQEMHIEELSQTNRAHMDEIAALKREKEFETQQLLQEFRSEREKANEMQRKEAKDSEE